MTPPELKDIDEQIREFLKVFEGRESDINFVAKEFLSLIEELTVEARIEELRGIMQQGNFNDIVPSFILNNRITTLKSSLTNGDKK